MESRDSKRETLAHPLLLAALLTAAEKVASAQLSTDGCVNRQNVVSADSGIRFCLKREGKSDTGPDVDQALRTRCRVKEVSHRDDGCMMISLE